MPFCPSAGVAMRLVSPGCSASITRRISSKLRPTFTGQVNIRRIFRAGSMMITDRTAAVSLCSGWVMPCSFAIMRSASATIGKRRSVFWGSLTSAIHVRYCSALSVDRPSSLVLRCANCSASGAVCAHFSLAYRCKIGCVANEANPAIACPAMQADFAKLGIYGAAGGDNADVQRNSRPPLGLAAGTANRRCRLPRQRREVHLRSADIEAIGVHYLGPYSYEVAHELRLAVVLRVDLGISTQHGI